MFGHANRHANKLQFVKRKTSRSSTGRRVIVLANRAPFKHERTGAGHILVTRSASGLVTALEPLLEACSGTWVAHGSGSADAAVVDDRRGLDVPPARPQYRLRYVWLSEDEHSGYYYGFANEGLWPLCHDVDVPPVFRPADFLTYQAVNIKFAAAVAEEANGGSPVVLVQDYHFALAPLVLRQRLPSSTILAFWHIPWPRPREFRACPWATELLEGLLASSIVGFQTREDCLNFLGCVEATLDADVDVPKSTVTYRRHSTIVRAYPVGVDWANEALRMAPSPAACRARLCDDLRLPSNVFLGVGVDRLDYTKGINEKFLAIERLLEARPELRERFVFLQIAEPSRSSLPAYRAARAQIRDTSGRVNRRFGTSSYQPIHLLEAHHEPADVYQFYRAADLCYVGSLHDGMNLVAKEFVAARDDERGVLVLSESAGAAQQLRAALMVNPYDVDRSAAALDRAVEMPVAEQSKRMKLLRTNVETFSASWWAHRLLGDAMSRGRGDLDVRTNLGSLAEQVPA
jgi:trehalose 6-phosphate synthase